MQNINYLEKTSSYKSAKYLLLFFISCSLISLIYSLLLNKYNGDFLGMAVEISPPILILNFIFSVIPFWFTWKLYRYFKKRPATKCITIPVNFFSVFLIVVMVWNIVVTLIYGVGVMAAPDYEAPAIIKPIIQIMNRFNYFYGVFIYVLATSKRNRTQIILIIMLLLLSYLRAGLGVVMYLGMLFAVKYYDEIALFARRNALKVVLILSFLPPIISLMYDVRNLVRNKPKEEFTVGQMIFGRLVGRLSSLSDSAMIIQNAPYFYLNAQMFDSFYFQRQALGGVFGRDLMPTPRPEQVLFWLYYPDSEENVAYMPGTNGGLYFALMKSVPTFIINLISYMVFIVSTFVVTRLLKFKYSNELALMLLLYVLTSGVPNEYSFIVFSIFVFAVLFIFVNLLKGIGRNRPNYVAKVKTGECIG